MQQRLDNAGRPEIGLDYPLPTPARTALILEGARARTPQKRAVAAKNPHHVHSIFRRRMHACAACQQRGGAGLYPRRRRTRALRRFGSPSVNSG